MNYRIYQDLPSTIVYPITIQIQVGLAEYQFEFHYNDREDRFSVWVRNLESEILFTTKVNYFQNIIQMKINSDLDPQNVILFLADREEMDSSEPNYFHSTVNKSNLFQTVFLVQVDANSLQS